MLYAGASAGPVDPGAYGDSGDAPDGGGADVLDDGELSRLTATSVSSPLKRIALGPVRGGGEGGGGEATPAGGGEGGGAGAEETTRFTPASHKTSAGSEDETTVICGSLPSAEGRVSVDSSPPSSNAQYATKESYERCHCTGGIAW